MSRESDANHARRGTTPGEPFILDRFGRAITAGSELVLMQPAVTTILVRSISAAVNVDPRAPQLPPGMMRVRGIATFDILAPKGVPSGEFILARTREQLIAAGVIKETPEGQAPGPDAVTVAEEGEPVRPEPPVGPKLVMP